MSITLILNISNITLNKIYTYLCSSHKAYILVCQIHVIQSTLLLSISFVATIQVLKTQFAYDSTWKSSMTCQNL